MRKLTIGTALLLALAACGALPTNPAVCARPGIPSIVATIRDDAGRPAAMGATVVIRNRAGHEESARGYGDSLRVAVGESEGGAFQVRVSKPWHAPAVLENVQVPADACGVERSHPVSVVLPRLPGAPPVRQVVAAPHGYVFGWGNLTATLRAFVEADAGVSRQVEWTSRDTTVARVTPAGALTSACRTAPGQTWVVAGAVADPSVRDSVPVSVFVDTDPQRCPPR